MPALRFAFATVAAAALAASWLALVPANAAERAGARELRDAVNAYQAGDYASALERLKPLAKRGIVEAQYYLGFMHAQGLGMPNDFVEAAKWYKRAALQGHVQAQNYLGLLYYEGRGVPRDFHSAFVYFELAAAAGNEDAINNRLIVARKMTSEQITAAQKEAGRILGEMAAEQHVPAPRQLSSGVVINAAGDVLTHRTAIKGCTELKVRMAGERRPAKVIAVDPFNGFAVLAGGGKPKAVAAFRAQAIEPGEAVTVVGYHLDEDLSVVPQVTETAVDAAPALKRLDERYVQIGAAFEGSNLGAPVFDSSGNLIGILETGVSPDEVAEVRGEPPVVLSFALRPRFAQVLLDMYDIDFATRDSIEPLDPAAYEEFTRNAAVAVECWAKGS